MNTHPKQADELVLNELAVAYGDESKSRELLEAWSRPNGPVRILGLFGRRRQPKSAAAHP